LSLFISPVVRATNAANALLPGAKWYFYFTGTLAPAPIYNSSSLDGQHSNPVVANSAGLFAPIYLNPSVTYRAILKDAIGAVIQDIDPINGESIDDLQFLQAGTGAVARTAQSKMRDWLSVYDFGAVGDGTADDTSALAAADAAAVVAKCQLLFPSGTFRVAANTTLNSRILSAGGILTVDSGKTLTLRGRIVAPLQQIFTGAGSVVGVRECYPEWFGAVGDGVTDDLAALNKAHACVQASKLSRGGRQKILLAGKTYGVSASWVVAPNVDVGLIVEGAGTGLGGSRLTDIAAFTSTTTPVFQVDGQTDAIQMIADWGLKDFGVVKGAGLATIGVQLGSTSSTKMLIGEGWQTVDDIYVQSFANNWKICHVRQIRFSRLSSWNNGYVGACVPMLITVNGATTSDLCFDDTCQFVSNNNTTSGTRCIKFDCSSGNYNNATAANQIGGICFGNCDFYSGEVAVEIYCSNGGYISDLWFMGTQVDQGAKTAYKITADKTTATAPTIQDINIDAAYIYGGAAAQIILESSSAGIVREVNIEGCYSNGAAKEFVSIIGTSGGVKSVTVNNNRIVNNNNTTAAAIDLGTVDGAHCCNNRLAQTDGSSAPKYMVAIASGALHYVVSGNSGHALPVTSVVNDLGGAVTKSVTGNI
jgi:hypothetical protein